MPQVVIRNDKTGEEYQIDSADFRRGKHYRRNDPDGETYAAAGFEIVSLPEGEPYTGTLNQAPSERAAAAERSSEAKPS